MAGPEKAAYQMRLFLCAPVFPRLRQQEDNKRHDDVGFELRWVEWCVVLGSEMTRMIIENLLCVQGEKLHARRLSACCD